MKHFFLTLFAIVAMALSVQARDYGQYEYIRLWDNATAPHSNKITAAETESPEGVLSNITNTELYVFKANAEKNTGQAILICPGGGYYQVAMKHEGIDVAKWLAENGITAIVLKYRCPNGIKEIPLEDAVKAMTIIRNKAKFWNINPNKVGIMGFSAGGHLAAYTSNFAPKAQRPNFTILFYPVISSDKNIYHGGSFKNLLGNVPEKDRLKYSMDRCVTSKTPPTILFLSDHDGVVPPQNSTLYYNALKKNNVDASLHIFPDGGHGWGFHEDFEYKNYWKSLLLNWLAKRQSYLYSRPNKSK